ncbi:MAG: DUF1294 domain-containing protein [Lachnospiraceae bacterium]|nr:DUF1294 domain-containing protein [Lachnospiraceae bacterium]
MNSILLLIIILINITAFFLYGRDKRLAVRHAYRIPERVLLAAAFFGGSAGALLGMLVFHHKTKKTKFLVLVPLFLILHILLVLVAYGAFTG